MRVTRDRHRPISILAAPLTLEDPEPTIAVTALADSAIELLCGAWTRTTDDLTAYRSLLADVSVRFDAAGITIPIRSATCTSGLPERKPWSVCPIPNPRP